MSLAAVMAQLAAMEAQIGVLQVQVQTVKHLLASGAVEPDTRPERCRDVPVERCGLKTDDEDARYPIPSFADPHAWKCRNCTYRSDHPEG